MSQPREPTGSARFCVFQRHGPLRMALTVAVGEDTRERLVARGVIRPTPDRGTAADAEESPSTPGSVLPTNPQRGRRISDRKREVDPNRPPAGADGGRTRADRRVHPRVPCSAGATTSAEAEYEGTASPRRR